MDIHWVSTGEKTKTKPNPNPISFGARTRKSWVKIIPEPESARPETRGYPTRTHPVAIPNEQAINLIADDLEKNRETYTEMISHTIAMVFGFES